MQPFDYKSLKRSSIVDKNFIQALSENIFPKEFDSFGIAKPAISKEIYLKLFKSGLTSRHLDIFARVLKDKGAAFYTIGSSGHEANAVLGHLLSLNDKCFLHYRSGALMIERAKKGEALGLCNSPTEDALLSLISSKFDVASGGRHKVFGHPRLNVPPQTSTIASHLPKALGAAFAIPLSKTLKCNKFSKSSLELHSNEDIVFCSFGDASFNHSTLQGTLNAISRLRFGQYPLPLILFCEDNGLGISTPTPPEWIESAMKGRIGIEYLSCNGLDLDDVYQASQQAIAKAKMGQCVFLHMKTHRLMGHAGSDIEFQYLSEDALRKQEQYDPLLFSAKIILEQGWMNNQEILELYEQIRHEISSIYDRIVAENRHLPLASTQEVMASMPKVGIEQVSYYDFYDEWNASFNKPSKPDPDVSLIAQKDTSKKETLASAINLSLRRALEKYSHMVLFGEDVGVKGGVYQVTTGLKKLFSHQVFDSILDEQTILGMAIGFAGRGLLPVAEIQFMAYIQNAIDQLRGEAATASFFSNGHYLNPMLIRLPGLGYQKGFGGHFHNENAIAYLREIPSIIVACPATPQEGYSMMQTCLSLVDEKKQIVVFLEPIALYATKDLFEEKDNIWIQALNTEYQIEYQQLGIFNFKNALQNTNKLINKPKILIISYANGFYNALKAAKQVSKHENIEISVCNLRWLVPLPKNSLRQLLNEKKQEEFTHILIVDECRRTGSLSEEILSFMVDESLDKDWTVQRLCAIDCFITTGPSAAMGLPSVNDIVGILSNWVNSKN